MTRKIVLQSVLTICNREIAISENTFLKVNSLHYLESLQVVFKLPNLLLQTNQ